MKCMAKELLAVLPQRIRAGIDAQMIPQLQEIRLRSGGPVILHTDKGFVKLDHIADHDDLAFVINSASRYSPWSAASAAKGYLTAPGGHRIGICGEAVCDGSHVTGIRGVSSLCIRVAKDIPGVSRTIAPRESILILGPPGSGKTTLLRDLIRRISQNGGQNISVVDERGELFPKQSGRPCFEAGDNTDILTGCGKSEGIDMVLRAMGPEWIAVDEITAEADCQALLRAGWCGVKLLATAHASGVADLRQRSVYKPLAQTKLFSTVIVLHPDKTFHSERLVL